MGECFQDDSLIQDFEADFMSLIASLIYFQFI